MSELNKKVIQNHNESQITIKFKQTKQIIQKLLKMANKYYICPPLDGQIVVDAGWFIAGSPLFLLQRIQFNFALRRSKISLYYFKQESFCIKFTFRFDQFIRMNKHIEIMYLWCQRAVTFSR